MRSTSSGSGTERTSPLPSLGPLIPVCPIYDWIMVEPRWLGMPRTPQALKACPECRSLEETRKQVERRRLEAVEVDHPQFVGPPLGDRGRVALNRWWERERSRPAIPVPRRSGRR
jgi:hypothetical protein